MNHIPSELVVFCDVDKTLVSPFEDFDNGTRIDLNYYGKIKKFRIHLKNIEFLRSLKERGYYIVVMSGNGSEWAKETVKGLKIEHLVDLTMMKPLKYIDDLECKEWMGARIYLEEEKNE